MAKDTFRGGVHPDEKKELSRDQALRVYDAKGEMVFLLSQHIGKPAKPLVKKNDEVLVGQVIAEADGYVSAHVISSCSGKVKAIEKRRTLSGAMMDAIVEENDGQFRPLLAEEDNIDPMLLGNAEILDRVQMAGIVGLGGAGFPTHVKLAPKDPSAIKYVIANGAECEPYITCNDQLMRTKAAEIVEGVETILRLFPNAEGVIAIEHNKPEAIEAMKKACHGKKNVRVVALPTKYPQGGERSLIAVIAGVYYPASMLPADVGCIVDNVATIYAIQQAVRYGRPLIQNDITVTGEAVANPCNLTVRIGTSFAELLEAAGGLKEGVTLKKALCGGPMMGIAMSSLDVPTQKTSNALTLLAEDAIVEAREQVTGCLRCGRCAAACPQGLLPQQMLQAIHQGQLDRFEKKYYGMECISCGTCSYICPARRPLTESFKQAKAEVIAARRAAAAGGKK